MILTPKTINQYHIFLASPGDVSEERQAVRKFIEQYNRTTAQQWNVQFVVVDWENYTTTGVGRPQDLITQQTLERYRGSLALVVSIMGQRFGSPTGKAESGTEEEFNWAMESYLSSGFPEIKWFFRKAEKLEMPTDLAQIRQATEQWEKVLGFRERMRELDNPLFYAEYPNSATFAEVLARDLSQWLAAPTRPWALHQPMQRWDPQPSAQQATRCAYTTQDLQLWVERHHIQLAKGFERIKSVRARRVHVSLPVRLDLATGAEDTRMLQPDDLAPLLEAGGSQVVLLSGDGGAGKTSLAFAIARWLLEGKPGAVVRLPVLIETGLAEGETVAEKVLAWLNDHLNEPHGAELVEALLRERRLVPILDHVSELSPVARQRLLAGLPPGLVLATSRSEDDGWTARALSHIRPLPIALDRLQTFFVEYLKAIGRDEILRDDELVAAQIRLRRIVGEKPITALLAQMFIDDVIANQAKGLLAGSVPQLMLSYVRRIDTPADPIQRERAGLTINRDLVQRALKRLALASHQQEVVAGEPAYQPREFSRGLAKATLKLAEPDGLAMTDQETEALLAYLSELRLLVHPGEDTSELRFPLDPLADYLAALAKMENLELLSRSVGEKVAWDGFLEVLEQRQAKGEDLWRARGFVLALRDAALERDGRGVALGATDRLAQLGGLNPEKERERLAEQRARRWTWDLDEPDASERRYAMGKLGAMAADPKYQTAVSVVASDRLSQVLANGELPSEDRDDAAVVLALIGSDTGVEALERLAMEGGQPAEQRKALEALGLAAKRLGDERSSLRERIVCLLEEQLRADSLDLWVEGAEGWAEHDRRLPVLQGASRGLQLAASAELPLLGCAPGREVPMLTLTALKEGEGLRIRTEVVTPAVWRLPLPECPEVGPQQLELVVVPGGEYEIGSPEEEAGRDVYTQFRQKCAGG
ncbi:MAG: hypothetical protein ACKO1V_08365 [Cyanobium sp.]